MSGDLLIPAFVAAALAMLAASGHRRLRPDVAARLLTLTIAAVTVALVPAMAVLALKYVTHVSWFAGAMSWCHHTLGLHDPVPWWIGLPCIAGVAAAVVRVARLLRTWRRVRCHASDGIEVLASDDLFAYTMPGPAGHIVVSTALYDRLDDRQLSAVLAHERSHAVHRHDRYILVSSVAVAIVPFLRPLQVRQRFALERWADEDAVGEVAGDRSLVARTLARVALSRTVAPAGAVGIVAHDVTGRVLALLEPPTARRRTAITVSGLLSASGVLAAAAVQAHHLLPLLHVVCPG